MKDFNSKVLYIYDEAIDKNMNVLSDFCENLNDLSNEFKNIVGFTPDLETIMFLLTSENKEFYRFIQGFSPNNFPKTLHFSEFQPSEKLIEFVKESYVKHRTDIDSIQVAGVKLNFKKMLGLVDYPSFDNLISILRNAMVKHYIVYSSGLKNFLKKDFSNIYEKGGFNAMLLKDEITAFHTIMTQTQDDNDLADEMADVCTKLNSLQTRGYKLFAHESMGDGVFRGIDYFIDRKNQTFVVSRRLLERKIAIKP
jgi:hypothetical protein